MTAHEFAMHLLEGPDLPVVVPKVREYCEEPAHHAHPVAVRDDVLRIVVITYCKEANRGERARELLR